MNPLTLTFSDVNEAYTDMQINKMEYCEWEETRNGPALVYQAPVIVSHVMPYRRVLFDPVRDANPFFHYMEAIWMLSGSNNVDFPASFAKQIREYSDDGITLSGAYGFRWRYYWDYDQLEQIIYMLKKDPTTRRAVLSMWDPQHDLEYDSKDTPCNTHIYFRVVNGKLDMTVCNRSNDLVWGMLGANIVHMSILQEYIANATGLPVGTYHQFTNNLHVYEGWEEKYSHTPSRWYGSRPAIARWNFSPDTLLDHEAQRFVDQGLDTDEHYTCRIIRDNAEPILLAWLAHKDGDDDLALHHIGHIYDEDWQEGCRLWITRRMEK